MNYRKALEMIATGQINGESNNYKDTVYIMKQIATEALEAYQTKDLTDEEIWEVINRTARVGTEDEIRFKIAEAILKKAQET